MTLSSKLFTDRMLTGFDRLTDEIQTRQSQVTTGRAITEAADAPLDAVRLSAREEVLSETRSYQASTKRAITRLEHVDDTLAEVDMIMIRLNELAVRANSGVLGSQDRQAISAEARELRDALLALANTTDDNGQALFGGYAMNRTPFVGTPEGRVAYRGDDGIHTVAAGDSLRLETSVNGREVFDRVATPSGTRSLFDVVDAFIAGLDLANTASTRVHSMIGDGLRLDIVTKDWPTELSLRVDGPEGRADISAKLVRGVPDPLIAAINAASATTGVAAASTEDGSGIILTAAEKTSDITLSELTVEGDPSPANPALYGVMLGPTDGSIPTKNLLPVSHGLEARMAELSEMQNAVALSRTKVGSFLGKAERQQSVLSDRTAVLEADVGELRDADLQRVITELQSLLLTQDAARQAYSKIGQRSLFDFLR